MEIFSWPIRGGGREIKCREDAQRFFEIAKDKEIKWISTRGGLEFIAVLAFLQHGIPLEPFSLQVYC
jgi:hypothetical protein